jgi:hypothetical protein
MQGMSQDTTKTKFGTFVNFDVVSQYVWRGVQFNAGPNIQPIVGVTYSKFTLGAVSSVAVANSYFEVDPFVSYQDKWVKATVMDYSVDLSPASIKYTNYTDTAKYHTVLADVTIGNAEKFPLLCTISTALYGGLDQDVNGKQKYTTYFELTYKGKNFDIFAAALTGSSDFYGNTKNEISAYNVGAKVMREIKVNNDFKIPLSGAIILNPTMEKLYFVITMSF